MMKRVFQTAALALVAVFMCQVALTDTAEARRRNRESTEESSHDVIAKGDKPWYFYYLAAEEHAARQEWTEAKENYIIAISIDPEPEVKKRIINKRTTTYFPYLRLANAYYYLNDVSNAEKYLQISESKNIAPRDQIGKLWALIIAGRKKPLIFLYYMAERSPNSFVNVRGIAYDYHDVTKVMVGEVEATSREATIDDIKMLPSNPGINSELYLDKVFFEAIGVPLLNKGANVIPIRALATNPDRKSDVYELTIFRYEKDKLNEEAASDSASDTSAEEMGS